MNLITKFKKFFKNLKNLKLFIQQYFRIILTRKIQIDESQKNIKEFQKNCLEKVATPEIEQMPVYSYVLGNKIKRKYFSTPDIYTAHLEKVIYYPRYETLFTKSRQLITDSVMDRITPEKYSIRTLYFAQPIEISGVCSVFRSIFDPKNYYHTSIDYLPRIYLLTQPEYANLEEIKLLVSEELSKSEQYFLDRIAPKNLQIHVVRRDRIYFIEKMIFPSFLTHVNSGYLPSKYLNFLLDKVCPQRPRKKENRIYISRTITDRSNKRCVLNENELIEKLKVYGFEKYNLENMSIEEQIELFYDASHVIAPHGAGLTNIMFAEKIKVLELFPASCVLPHYYYLSKSLGHKYKYWCGRDRNKDANFEVDIPTIFKLLENLEEIV
jgi:hypothetical protein